MLRQWLCDTSGWAGAILHLNICHMAASCKFTATRQRHGPSQALWSFIHNKLYNNAQHRHGLRPSGERER